MGEWYRCEPDVAAARAYFPLEDTMSPRTALLILTALLAGCSRHESPIPLTPNCAGHGAIGTVVLIGAGDVRRGDVAFEPEERSGATGYVEAFDIDATEVTRGQFAQFVAATGYVTVAERVGPEGQSHGAAVFDRTTGGWRLEPSASWRAPLGRGSSSPDDAPVVAVAYEDAVAYAAWRGRRLPTEREWERAARADRPAPPDVEAERRDTNGAWLANSWQGAFPTLDTAEDGYAGVSPVGCFPPNTAGLHDMVGNVWEWTADWFSPTNAPASPAEAVASDPERLGKRVIKGGSHLCASNFCARYRSGSRQPADPTLGTSHIGFRTVRSR